MIIWLLQTGESLHSDQENVRPMRAMNLANKLVQAGHRVVLWSSAFCHQTKTHRSKIYEEIKISENLEIRLIPSTGYKRNISISRFYDHCVLAWNLCNHLESASEIPDVAFVGYPPIEVAYVMSAWLKKRQIPFLLDVKDQWPDILVQSFPRGLRYFARLLLTPYYLMAKKAMLNATGICAHTSGFVNWSSIFSNQDQGDHNFVAPLTAPDDIIETESMVNAYNWWSNQGVVKTSMLRVMFVGSFSRAFDFDAIFDAASELCEKQIACEFILCGDGDKDNELRSKASQHDNIKIIGWIDRPKIKALSTISDVMIAPYKSTDDFTISIPNKIIDSLMLGLPILSPLKGEVASLITKFQVGFSYGDNPTLTDCINSLIADQDLLKQISNNASNQYKSQFDFNKVYGGLVGHLEYIRNK